MRAVALEQVRAVAGAVDLPVIGMGGIASGRDAADFLAAGATCVAVGTESFRDPAAGRRIAAELDAPAGARFPKRTRVRPHPGDIRATFSRKVRDLYGSGDQSGISPLKKALQTKAIRSSYPNQPQAQVEVQLNSPFFCVCRLDGRASACTIAAHAGRPADARQDISRRV